MLKNETEEEVDLFDYRDRLKEYLPDEVQPFFLGDNWDAWELQFPVERYPEKVRSLNLSKTPEYEGKLVGIKAQYFIFEDDTVFNVRGNEGFVVELNTSV